MEQTYDVALLVPSWSPLKDWRDRTHLYVHQRPLATAPGARVWLVKDRRIFHSYRIEGFVDLEAALPGEAETETGWALVVTDGHRANRDIEDIPDPHGVATRWMQGFRYMTSGAAEFARAPRRPARKPMPAPVEVVEDEGANGVDPSGPTPATVPAERSWAGRLARLLGRKE